MNCCQCQGIEAVFDAQLVAKELVTYRDKGPNQTTRILVEALKAEGIQGGSLLDIGGGVGAVQHELLSAGVRNATDVDASLAYLNAAKAEAQRRGLSDRLNFQHGNFVDIAAQIPPADIVTLDRVICCYPDMEKLVSLSVGKVRQVYGLVYPRDVWWVKIGVKVVNFFFRLRKNPFRTFIHPTRAVEAIANAAGFQRCFYRHTLVWQVVVYSR
jgi:2-polyprenyl-3-methyl-5-hydroxy-6-metoxy-1,4-benzoquinol methylase